MDTLQSGAALQYTELPLLSQSRIGMATVLQGDVSSIVAAICSRAHRLHSLRDHSLDAGHSLIRIQQAARERAGTHGNAEDGASRNHDGQAQQCPEGDILQMHRAAASHTQSVSDSALLYSYMHH